MECFYHPATPAVGICKYCQKGLCRTCAVDVDGDGLACQDRHEQIVRWLSRYTRQAPRTGSRSGLVLIGIGVVFVVFGLSQVLGSALALGGFLLVVGVAFLLQGANMLKGWRSQVAPNAEKAPNEFRDE